jgi:hypothetical protein
MQGTLPAAPPKPSLPLRIRVGIWVTVASLIILVYPGQMSLPLVILDPLMPRTGGCFSPLGPIVFLLFFGVGYLMSLLLLGLGIAAVVMASRGTRRGLVMAVQVNAVVASLLLIPALAADHGELGTFGLLAVVAVVPLTAMVLLLFPSAYRSSRQFLITTLVAAVLLVPAAFGVVALGQDLAGVGVPQPANAQPNGTQRAC